MIVYHCPRPCDADKLVDRQTSAPTGYVSSTSPIVIKRLNIKKEAASPAPAPARGAGIRRGQGERGPGHQQLHHRHQD